MLAQAFAVVGCAGAFGLLLDRWGPISTSFAGRLAESLGVPAVPLLTLGAGFWIAQDFLRKDWRHCVTLRETDMRVTDQVSDFTVPYANIAGVRQVPLGGVVIAFEDSEAWLASLSRGGVVRRRTSAALRTVYEADILIRERNLDVGSAAFVELLTRRLEATAPKPTTAQRPG